MTELLPGDEEPQQTTPKRDTFVGTPQSVSSNVQIRFLNSRIGEDSRIRRNPAPSIQRLINAPPTPWREIQTKAERLLQVKNLSNLAGRF
jgi:hypothetical protein